MFTDAALFRQYLQPGSTTSLLALMVLYRTSIPRFLRIQYFFFVIMPALIQDPTRELSMHFQAVRVSWDIIDFLSRCQKSCMAKMHSWVKQVRKSQILL